MPQFLIRSKLTGNRLVCLPFSDYCYPLGDETAISLLLNNAKNDIETGHASFLEIRNRQNEITSFPIFQKRDYFQLYLLDLEPGIETVSANAHLSIRRGIKQAKKRGVTVRISDSEEDMKKFHDLNVRTRKKLGVLPQPYKFFQSIHRHIISQGLGFCILAEWEGKVIAGVIFLIHKNVIYYKFSASDQRYLTLRPNNLVIWNAITLGCERGLKYLDFGRCTPEEEGLRVFKTRWGAKESSLPYYYFPNLLVFLPDFG